jgi:hypothetical protein
MSENIEKKTSDILDQVKSKTLTSKITDLKSKIAARNEFKNMTLLCDVSGSMDEVLNDTDSDTYKSYGTVKAIDVLNDIVKDFDGARIFEFSSNCSLVKPGTVLYTKGSTNLAGAFKYIKLHNVTETILLTDGAPDHHLDALREAKGLKLNIIYIGPQPTPKFLLDLGNLKDNKIDSVELLKAGATRGKELIEAKIKGFLGA